MSNKITILNSYELRCIKKRELGKRGNGSSASGILPTIRLPDIFGKSQKRLPFGIIVYRQSLSATLRIAQAD